MKKIITTLALVAVLAVPIAPPANAQELSPEREQVMRAQIEVLQQIVEKLLALYEARYGKQATAAKADPVSALGNFLSPYSITTIDTGDDNETETTVDEPETTTPKQNPLSALGNFLAPLGISSVTNTDQSSSDAGPSSNSSGREMATTLEGALGSVSSYAGALYLDKGTYSTVCNKSEVVAVRREYHATCVDSEGGYLVYTELDEGYFCVDATGFAEETDDVNERTLTCE